LAIFLASVIIKNRGIFKKNNIQKQDL